MDVGVGVAVGLGVCVGVGLAVGVGLDTTMMGNSVGGMATMGTMVGGVFCVGWIVEGGIGFRGAAIIISCRAELRIWPGGGTVAGMAVGMDRDGCSV